MTASSAERGTVLIVDDDAAVRNGLRLLMDAAGLATRSFASGPELLDCTQHDAPACLLLDLRMPGMDGLAVQQALQARGSELPIVFLTAHGDVPTAVRAVQNGALGFLEKPGFDSQELLELVARGIVQHGEALQRRQHSDRIQGRIAQLTRRELEVARLVASGRANKVIAAELGISERTVEVHRGRAMKKLELRQVAELVRLQHMLGES